MLFSIGYQCLAPSDLASVAAQLGATVIDVRTTAWGRVKRGFGRADLQTLLGAGYEWRGDGLGGRGAGPTEAGIARLQTDHAAGRTLLLLCQEEAPGDCHRHHRIAIPLSARGIEVMHVYRDEVFTARALQAALDEDARAGTDAAEYDHELLSEFLTSIRASMSAPL